MRKLLALVLVIMLVLPASAEKAFVKQVTIGRDSAGQTWYLTDYGVDYNTPYAVARKYYTSEAVKYDTIEKLESRYNVPESRASALYFTEYKYEYTPDGKQYSEVYRMHYDMMGKLIYGFEFDNSSGAKRKYFVKVTGNSIMSKGYSYAMGTVKR